MTDSIMKDAAQQATAMSNEQLHQNVKELNEFLAHAEFCTACTCVDWDNAAYYTKEAFLQELNRRRRRYLND